MPVPGARTLICLTLLTCGACEPDAHLLTVDIRTDVLAVAEFERARITLEEAAGTLGDVVMEHVADESLAYLEGQRVADFEALPAGSVRLRVELLARDGRVLAGRPLVVALSSDLAVTVVLTRDCVDVTCPGLADDPGAMACLGGQCVMPECTEENPAACGDPECTIAADCPSDLALCSGARCDRGVCLVEADDGMCDAGERCVPGLGCRDPGGGGFRRRITITQPVGSPVPAGYTIRVGLGDIDPFGAETDLSDVRVLSDGSAEGDEGLDRVIDLNPPGQDRAIWFALESVIGVGGTGTYWLHYGDADAPPSPDDPATVFPLFDAFDGAVLSREWTTLGTPTVSGSLVLGPGDTAVTTDSMADQVGANAVFEARVRTTGFDAMNTYYWVGFQGFGDFASGMDFQNWVGRDGIVHPWVNVAAATERCMPDIVTDDESHTYRIERGPSSTTYFRDGTLACEVSVVDTNDYSIQLRNQSMTAVVEVEWVRVRPLVSPEPEVAVGDQEVVGF